MKKIINAVFILIAVCLLTSSCYHTYTAVNDSLNFSVQYIRTDGYHEDVEYPMVFIVRSLDELNSHYEQFKDMYDLERRETVYSDSTIGFLDACDKYDDEYFEDNFLVFVILEESSGSVRHEVTSVGVEDGRFTVSVMTKVPDEGTDDMAQWHIILEIDKKIEISDDKITLKIDSEEHTVFNSTINNPYNYFKSYYTYYDSPDPVAPSVCLDEKDGTFTFGYSCFSSYFAHGKYELTDDTLTLKTDDGLYTYVFDAVTQYCFAFNASESSAIPSYKYSSDGEPQCPVPDGAEFVADLVVGSDVRMADIDYDIDGDGIIENCCITPGITSGVYSFFFSVYQDGVLEYHDFFTSDQYDFSFKKNDDGTVCLYAEGQEGDVHYFDIKAKDGYISLTENGINIGDI